MLTNAKDSYMKARNEFAAKVSLIQTCLFFSLILDHFQVTFLDLSDLVPYVLCVNIEHDV